MKDRDFISLNNYRKIEEAAFREGKISHYNMPTPSPLQYLLNIF
jgi:alpha-D-ribose 1-methylphosphonate 5-phosphate C-P lyase